MGSYKKGGMKKNIFYVLEYFGFFKTLTQETPIFFYLISGLGLSFAFCKSKLELQGI